jgi:DNA-binding CsgD family transcriptional regulator
VTKPAGTQTLAQNPLSPQSFIIGRASERAQLSRFLDSAAKGPVGVVIDGEAGIGKSTIWKESVADAESRSYRTLSCRTDRSEAPLSFAGLGDLFDPVIDEALPHLPAPQRHALEVALLRSDATGAGPDRRAVSVAVLAVLRSLTSIGPVLVAVDDVQWLDRPTARVLEFAFRRLEREPIGILVTLRAADWDADLVLATGFASYPTERLSLGPLSAEETDQLLRQRLGTWLPRPILRQVHRTAAGNPLYALEIAQAIRGEGVKWSSGLTIPIPDNLRRLIRERVSQLPAETREILLVVAALAQPTMPVVAQAVDDSAVTASALMRAAKAGLVEFEGDRIRFAHPLIGSVVFSDVPREARRPIHQRLADIVTDPEERARHLALSARRPDSQVAAALDEAARHANTRGAPDAAAELAEKALALTPGGVEDLTRRRLEAAEYHFAAGDTSRSREQLERAAADAPLGRSRAKVLLRLGTLKAHSDSVLEASDMLAEALVQAGDDPALTAPIHLTLCGILGSAWDAAGLATHARAALSLAEGLEDPAMTSVALSQLGVAEFLQGGALPVSRMEKALALEDWATGTPLDQWPSVAFGRVLMLADELEGARNLLAPMHHQALDRGDEGSLATILRTLSELECRAGNFELAATYALEGDQAALQTRQDVRRVDCLYVRALADAHLGRGQATREEVEEGLALGGRTQHATAALLPGVIGFLELSMGHAEEAHQGLSGSLEELSRFGVMDVGITHFWPDEIEALLTMGEVEEARSQLGSFQERARATNRGWALAAGFRCQGLLHAAEGDLPRAREALKEAIVRHQRANRPFELARTLLVSGMVERRAKQKRAARDALEHALATFDRLGASLWRERAREELTRIGGRVAKPWDLTPTEQRVAELAAAGRTNKEIAEALFLSIRTVEGSLSKAYHKLGVRSRTELAHKVEPATPPEIGENEAPG